MGWDAAGTVVDAGRGVDGFAVGDRVSGMPLFPRQAGCYGTFVRAPADHWSPSPSTIDDVQAAALPLAGLTAWQGLTEVADLRPGQRVMMISAAAGGVGHLAVQIAVALGAEVVAVTSVDHVDFIRSLGATEVLDRHRTDVAARLAGRGIDVSFDLVGGSSAVHSVTALRPCGPVVCVPGGTDAGVHAAAAAAGVRSATMSVHPDGPGLRELVDAGRVRVEVAEVFDLDDIRTAHTRLDLGRTRGKLVVRIP